MTLKRSNSCPSMGSITSLFEHKIKTEKRALDLQLLISKIKRSAVKPILLVDWDGCLCDSMTRIHKRIELVAKALKGKHPDTFNVSDELLKTPWTREYDAHLQFVFGDGFWKEAKDLCQGKFLNHEDIPDKSLFSGALEFLKTLKQLKLPFAIVSNGSNRTTHSSGIAKFPELVPLLEGIPIITSDDAKKNGDGEVKPNVNHFYRAFEKLGMSPKDAKQHPVIVIGDGPDSDMLGALNLSDAGFRVTAHWTKFDKQVNLTMQSTNSFNDIVHDVLGTVLAENNKNKSLSTRFSI